MTRRELLAAGALGATASRLLPARSRFDKTRISAITDEIGKSTDESIAFAHRYGLKFVEIRNPPGDKREYFTLSEPEIKMDAVRFANEGLKVSFINTSVLKFTWPGTELARRRPEDAAAREKRLAAEKARWDRRGEDLDKAIRCAHTMGCDRVRVFTGSRVADPPALYPRIAETLADLAVKAEREKVYLLVENEASQNVATSAELAELMKLAPSRWIGMNWDPHNAYGKETSFPDGYALLPKKRILNVQVKAKGVMPDSPEKEDWKGIMEALERDGYRGKIALETHIFDGTLIEAAHKSMDEIMRIVGQL
jgi:sugar phosphate isomerase/epimerase